MGRRYGRNQKRRHRALIAELTNKNAALQRRLDAVTREHRDLVEAIRHVNPNSILLPPMEVRLSRADVYLLPRPGREPQVLRPFRVQVDDEPMPAARASWVRVTTTHDGNVLGREHLISDEALRYAREPGLLFDSLAADIVRSFLNHIQGRGQHV